MSLEKQRNNGYAILFLSKSSQMRNVLLTATLLLLLCGCFSSTVRVPTPSEAVMQGYPVGVTSKGDSQRNYGVMLARYLTKKYGYETFATYGWGDNAYQFLRLRCDGFDKDIVAEITNAFYKDLERMGYQEVLFLSKTEYPWGRTMWKPRGFGQIDYPVNVPVKAPNRYHSDAIGKANRKFWSGK